MTETTKQMLKIIIKPTLHLKHKNIFWKDNTAKTLEPQIVKCNELKNLNEVLETDYDDKDKLANYMEKNKNWLRFENLWQH